MNRYRVNIIGTERVIPCLPHLAEFYVPKVSPRRAKKDVIPIFKDALARDDFSLVNVMLD
jgi:hypothetical protein